MILAGTVFYLHHTVEEKQAHPCDGVWKSPLCLVPISAWSRSDWGIGDGTGGGKESKKEVIIMLLPWVTESIYK
jgi:hypothetical protein